MLKRRTGIRNGRFFAKPGGQTRALLVDRRSGLNRNRFGDGTDPQNDYPLTVPCTSTAMYSRDIRQVRQLTSIA
jgi:hypothetical protein